MMHVLFVSFLYEQSAHFTVVSCKHRLISITHEKGNQVRIKTRSPPASFPFKGQVTEHVKWSIAMYVTNISVLTITEYIFVPMHVWRSAIILYPDLQLQVKLPAVLWQMWSQKWLPTLHSSTSATNEKERVKGISTSSTCERSTDNKSLWRSLIWLTGLEHDVKIPWHAFLSFSRKYPEWHSHLKLPWVLTHTCWQSSLRALHSSKSNRRRKRLC